MVQAIRNNKGQFFIVAAVIIIASMAVVHYNFTSISYSQMPTISSDAGFYFQSIENECGYAMQAILGRVSANQSLNVSSTMDSNLSNFESYVEDISARKGMVADVNHSINPGNTYQYVSADFNISLRTGSEHYTISDYTVTKSITITALLPVLMAGPFCVFDFQASMEGGQPIRNLTSLSMNPPFGLVTNGTIPLNPCFIAEHPATPGMYRTLCIGAGGCPGPIITINMTDHRGITGVFP
jgi:hypothetical protein